MDSDALRRTGNNSFHTVGYDAFPPFQNMQSLPLFGLQMRLFTYVAEFLSLIVKEQQVLAVLLAKYSDNA